MRRQLYIKGPSLDQIEKNKNQSGFTLTTICRYPPGFGGRDSEQRSRSYFVKHMSGPRLGPIRPTEPLRTAVLTPHYLPLNIGFFTPRRIAAPLCGIEEERVSRYMWVDIDLALARAQVQKIYLNQALFAFVDFSKLLWYYQISVVH